MCYEAPDPAKMRYLLTSGSDADTSYQSPLPLEYLFKFGEVEERVALLRSNAGNSLVNERTLGPEEARAHSKVVFGLNKFEPH